MRAAQDLRLVGSMLLFFFGGAAVSLEVFTALALLEGGRTLTEQALALERFVALAIACLAIATWITPLNRLRWLGRSILIGGGFGAFQAATVYATVPERWDLTWRIGVPNALVVLGIGYWLHRRAAQQQAETLAGVDVDIRRPGDPH